MLELRNLTPFPAAIFPALDKYCCDYLVVVTKASFDLECDGELVFSGEQQPVSHADDYFGDAGASSIRYCTDNALRKLSTDIILNAHARAPNEHACTSLDVILNFENRKICRRVYGDRYWRKKFSGWEASEPEHFTSMPLTYENAYGGQCEQPNGDTVFYSYNPIGKGFLADSKSVFEELPLPNIEDPMNLIGHWKQRPAPAGFGAVPPGWPQRSQYAGTYGAEWERNRSPLLPEDFDARFFNCAHPDLVVAADRLPGAAIEIENVCHSGPFVFRIPQKTVHISYSQAGARKSQKALLDTVIIEPDEKRILVVWRATIPARRRLMEIEWVTIRGDF